MPVQGPQTPGFFLPGAEYLALAPNSTIALNGRRRFVNQPTQIPVPADGAANFLNQFTLEQPFTDTSGIYLHYFWLALNPASPGLAVNATLAGLTRAPAAQLYADYPLGYPVLVNPAPDIGIVLLTAEDRLITAKDITAIARGVGNTQTLTMYTLTTLTNAGAAAINVSTIVGIVYTRLDGLTE